MYTKIKKNELIVTTDMEDGELICLDITTGEYFGMDSVAKDIWEALDEKDNIDGLLEHLLQIYDVETEQLKRDIEAYLDELRDNELITYGL